MKQLPTPEECLLPGFFIDSDHPDIRAYVDKATAGLESDLAKAVALYYRVRDDYRYNPYLVATAPDAYKASATLSAGHGWCVTKALLLAALCRAAGIPARVGYADVRNHLSTERLRQSMQTDVFYYHGYTSVFLNGRWVKATPAFNIELCEKFGLRPLEFDGLKDSLYHEFDMAGQRHMEYLNERGEYFDLPFEDLMAVMREHYPLLVSGGNTDAVSSDANWDEEVKRETAS